jgi:hemerythrin
MKQRNMEYAYELPEVELEFMNDDHARVVELVNALVAQFDTATPDQAAVTQALVALQDDCKTHFAREEALMEKYAFPPYGCHKGAHEAVLNEIATELQHWQSEQNITRLDAYIQQAFVPWLLNHVSTMDTVTALFIKHQGGN